MARQMTPRARLKGLFPNLRALLDKASPTPETTSPTPETKKYQKIERTLLRPLQKAFETAGLDIDNKAHWEQLLVWLAWAVYGGKGAGAPRKWTPKTLRRLLGAVNELRAEDPTMRETRCCALLSKGKGGQGRYKGKNARTLRRALQNAKALDGKARLLATPVREVLRSETAGAETEPKTIIPTR
jgi:hypothetical protein